MESARSSTHIAALSDDDRRNNYTRERNGTADDRDRTDAADAMEMSARPRAQQLRSVASLWPAVWHCSSCEREPVGATAALPGMRAAASGASSAAAATADRRRCARRTAAGVANALSSASSLRSVLTLSGCCWCLCVVFGCAQCGRQCGSAEQLRALRLSQRSQTKQVGTLTRRHSGCECTHAHATVHAADRIG